MNTSEPTGFNCEKCGHRAEFSMWAYAHWDEGFFATCTECSTKHYVSKGMAKLAHPKLSPDERRQDLEDACVERGYELVWIDLDSGEFHLRKGAEVLTGRIDEQSVDSGPAVSQAIRVGVRLDQDPSSKYFSGDNRG